MNFKWKIMSVVLFLFLQVACLKCSDMTEKLSETVKMVTPNFEQNLKRAFINSGVRIQNRVGHVSHKLEDVLVTIDNSIVELRNLSLTRTPQFKIVNMEVDLEGFSIDIELNIGKLVIEGEYEVTNGTLQSVLPITHIGKIVFVLDNVMCKGKAGIYMTEDSFVIHNYDLEFSLSEVITKVMYYNQVGVEVFTETTEKHQDKTLVKTLWTQLNDMLKVLLHKQLGDVIVEYSASEILLDEPQEMVALTRNTRQTANRFVDTLLCNAKSYINTTNQAEFDVPSMHVVFKGRPPGVLQGTFDTSPGRISNLSTLTRITETSFFEDSNGFLIFYCTIRMREFKFSYNSYKGEYNGILSEGYLNATIYRNTIFVKISVERDNNNKCVPKLDTVQVREVKDVDVDISGLGALGWLSDRLTSWTKGHLREKACPCLEEKIRIAIAHAIKTTNCDSLLNL